MTLKEIEKKFPFSGKDGPCKDCAYLNICTSILPGLVKPKKCGGPFVVEDLNKFKAVMEDLVENQKDIPPEIAKIIQDNFWDLMDDGETKPETNPERERIVNSIGYNAAKNAINYYNTVVLDDNVVDAYEEGASFGYTFAIGKVCRWLKKNINSYPTPIPVDKLIEDIKKALDE